MIQTIVEASLTKTAEMNGISREEVISQINLAISEAVSSLDKYYDRSSIEKWKEIAGDNRIPTAEELLAYVIGKYLEKTFCYL